MQLALLVWTVSLFVSTSLDFGDVSNTGGANVTEPVQHNADEKTQSNSTKALLRERIKTSDAMICGIVKNEQLYVDEWLAYHRYLGFNHIHLFDNAHNASKYLSSLPEKYGDFLQVTHMRGLGMQIVAYAKCIKDGAESNTWAAFLDVDEFIVLRKHANITEFLLDVAPTGGSVVLNWSIMGSNNSMTYSPAPVVARFTLTTIAPNPHIKTIAYLPHTREPSIHNMLLKPGHPTVDQHGRHVNHKTSFNPGNDREIAHINHYYTKSWEEFKLKRRRGFATNFRKNVLFSNDSEQTVRHLAADYKHANEGANAVQDTFARDFYLSHLQQ